MPVSKKRTTRKPKAKPRTPKDEAAQVQPDGVIVTLTPAGDGSEDVGFRTLGTTKPREVPVILRQAAAIVERRMGG